MTSNAFIHLEKTLSGLSSGLLPSREEQSDINYDENNWKERVSGYIILSHAAFENYIEEIARELLRKAHNNFSITNIPNNILVSLVLSYRIYWPPPDNSCQECFGRKYLNCFGKYISNRKLKQEERSFEKAIKSAIYDYFIPDVIEINHGATIKHINTIFILLGLNTNLLDDTFKTDLNDFCSIRGKLAHTTTTSGTTIILSSNIAKNTVEKLLGGKPGIWGFKEFDAFVMNLQ